MADEVGISTKIEKLNDVNIYAWKQKIVLVLALKDVEELNLDDPATDDKDQKVWHKRDRKARLIIGLQLSGDHLEHVRDADTEKEIWPAILNVFGRHTLLNKRSVRRKFYMVTMGMGENILHF